LLIAAIAFKNISTAESSADKAPQMTGLLNIWLLVSMVVDSLKASTRKLSHFRTGILGTFLVAEHTVVFVLIGRSSGTGITT